MIAVGAGAGAGVDLISHSFIRSLTHSLIHSFAQSLVHSLIRVCVSGVACACVEQARLLVLQKLWLRLESEVMEMLQQEDNLKYSSSTVSTPKRLWSSTVDVKDSHFPQLAQRVNRATMEAVRLRVCLHRAMKQVKAQAPHTAGTAAGAAAVGGRVAAAAAAVAGAKGKKGKSGRRRRSVRMFEGATATSASVVPDRYPFHSSFTITITITITCRSSFEWLIVSVSESVW